MEKALEASELAGSMELLDTDKPYRRMHLHASVQMHDMCAWLRSSATPNGTGLWWPSPVAFRPFGYPSSVSLVNLETSLCESRQSRQRSPSRLLVQSPGLAVFLPILCHFDMMLLLVETFQGRLLETSL